MHQQKLKNSDLEIGDILYITLDILSQKRQSLLLMLIGINLPLLLVGQLMPKSSGINFSFLIIYIVLNTLEWVALLIITEKTILEEKVTSKSALKQGFYKLRKLLFKLLVMWVIYVIFVGFGYILFVVPGIYIATTRYFFSEAIALRNANFFESFQYSVNLVKGNFWKVFILTILASTTSIIVATPTDFLPEFPVLETMFFIILELCLKIIFYIVRIIITVSFLNLDYVRNGLPNRI
jgi:hypothetical protein